MVTQVSITVVSLASTFPRHDHQNLGRHIIFVPLGLWHSAHGRLTCCLDLLLCLRWQKIGKECHFHQLSSHLQWMIHMQRASWWLIRGAEKGRKG